MNHKKRTIIIVSILIVFSMILIILGVSQSSQTTEKTPKDEVPKNLPVPDENSAILFKDEEYEVIRVNSSNCATYYRVYNKIQDKVLNDEFEQKITYFLKEEGEYYLFLESGDHTIIYNLSRGVPVREINLSYGSIPGDTEGGVYRFRSCVEDFSKGEYFWNLTLESNDFYKNATYTSFDSEKAILIVCNQRTCQSMNTSGSLIKDLGSFDLVIGAFRNYFLVVQQGILKVFDIQGVELSCEGVPLYVEGHSYGLIFPSEDTVGIVEPSLSEINIVSSCKLKYKRKI